MMFLAGMIVGFVPGLILGFLLMWRAFGKVHEEQVHLFRKEMGKE